MNKSEKKVEKTAKRKAKFASTKKKIHDAHPFLNALRLMIDFLYVYVLIYITVLYIVPVVVSTIGGTMGLTYDSQMLDIIVLFGFPALFATALLFVAVIWLIKYGVKHINLFFKKLIVSQNSVKNNEKVFDIDSKK